MPTYDYECDACGHALEHYLEFGHSPELALELAERNWRQRPNAEAAAFRRAAREALARS